MVLCTEQGNQLRKGETVFGNDGHQWRFTGMDKRQGTWGVFVVPQQRNDHAIRIKPQPKAKPSVNRLHGGFRTGLTQAAGGRCHSTLMTLLTSHVVGLTPEQIQLMGAKTLKVIASNWVTWIQQRHIPARLVIGCQPSTGMAKSLVLCGHVLKVVTAGCLAATWKTVSCHCRCCV